jgi:hypothetical protein
MPLWLASFQELILRPAAPAAVQTFYSNFDLLEGLASWPATNLLPYLALLPVGRTACLPLLFSCDPPFLLIIMIF